MVFSSTLFVFCFLPVVLSGALLVPRALRNSWLLVASLIFYVWGEPSYFLVMVGSILGNYPLGLAVARWRHRSRAVVGLAVAANLALLAVFKYANFFVETVNALLAVLGQPAIAMAPVPLPIGISFFTFHAISYVVDVHRGDTEAQGNPFRLGLYLTLFPQLIAGPIVRYRDIADQLSRRTITLERFAYGVRRFVVGLGKKVLVANIVAVPADLIFALDPRELHFSIAWLGALSYTLQIYFDFSGYSDMAIGMGEMLGFRFRENFDYPYVADSVRGFWRRWHISLSTWFRDYLFIPLGGSRGSAGRTYVNLVTVFFLCGLWHGASFTFVVWGLYHGLFLALERTRVGAAIEGAPRAPRHLYTMAVVVGGWTIFRAPTLAGAWGVLGAMVGAGGGSAVTHPLAMYLGSDVALALLAGVLGSGPLLPSLRRWSDRVIATHPGPTAALATFSRECLALGALVAIFAACAMALSAQTHNPFIYYRF